MLDCIDALKEALAKAEFKLVVQDILKDGQILIEEKNKEALILMSFNQQFYNDTKYVKLADEDRKYSVELQSNLFDRYYVCSLSMPQGSPDAF
jgi:hypothetical protein